MYSENFFFYTVVGCPQCSNFCFFLLAHWSPFRSVSVHVLNFYPYQEFIHICNIPWSFFFPGWTMLSLPPSLHSSHAPIPSSSLWLFAGFVPLCPSSAYTRKFKTGLSIPYVTSLVLRRGSGEVHSLSLQAMWYCSWCNPGEAVCPPCHKGML